MTDLSRAVDDPAADTSTASPPAASAGPLRLDGAFARREREDWRRAAEASLGDGVTLESLARHTLDGLRVEVLHDDSPVAGRWVPPARSDGDGAATPAVAPVRARRDWEGRLAVLGADPAGANAHALAGLAGGVGALELRVGPRSSALPLDALDTALHGVHVELISLSLRAGEDAGAALDALLALYRARGQEPAAMRAALDADPLATLARDGRLDGGLDAAFARLADVATRAAEELPLASVATADMTVHHEAGASSVQELVAGIASATLALERLLDAGLAPAVACRAIVFRASCDADIVASVVKLRALERLWRHVLAESGLPVRRPTVVAETSRRQLSRLAPWVNHLRNVTAVTAAAIGDADAVLVHPHDLVDGRRIGDDAALADRVARNLPVLLAAECGLRDVADATGGAHAIESLTQATVEAAWHALGELQAAGGLAAALASGDWQSSVGRVHAARVARLRDAGAVRVGVNRYRVDAASARSAEDTLPATTPSRQPRDGARGGARHGVHDDARHAARDGVSDAARDGTLRAEPLRAVRDAAAFEPSADAGERS